MLRHIIERRPSRLPERIVLKDHGVGPPRTLSREALLCRSDQGFRDTTLSPVVPDGDRLSAIGYRLSAIGYRLSAIDAPSS
jgi:endonuclease YncB( thermonuclease family)